MSPETNAVHPLAKDVRTRRERMKNEAEVLAGIEPVRAYLNEHAEHLVQLKPQKTISLLVRDTARLGFYQDAKAWSQQYGDHRMNPLAKEDAPYLDHFIDEGRYLRGDYRLSLYGAETSWEPLKRVDKQSWVAHVALMNGDLDDADELLRHVANDRAGQSAPVYWWGLQQNCELAVLAHVMGRADLVLPALNRARYSFEAGPAMSTRPLEESPTWIQLGEEDSHLSLYLVLAIAGSGFGPTAMKLIEGKDLIIWGGKYREVFKDDYSFQGLYLCLANGGCLTEALDLARQDEDKPLGSSNFLIPAIATAFRWGEASIGEDLAREWFDSRRKLWSVDRFRKTMEAFGQTTWAEKATDLILQSELKRQLDAVFPYLGFLASLPDDVRRTALKDMQAQKERDWSEWKERLFLPSDLTTLEQKYETAIAVLGATPNIDKMGHKHGGWAVSALVRGGQIEAARRLLRSLVDDMTTNGTYPSCVEGILPLCATLGEMELVEKLIANDNPAPIFSHYRLLGQAVAARDDVDWAETFATSQKFPDLNHRLAACAGILAAAADSLTLCPNLKYQSVNKFPNFQVIEAVGLYPSVLQGISMGC